MILLFPVFSYMVVLHVMTRLALDQVEAMGQFFNGRLAFAFTRRVWRGWGIKTGTTHKLVEGGGGEVRSTCFWCNRLSTHDIYTQLVSDTQNGWSDTVIFLPLLVIRVFLPQIYVWMYAQKNQSKRKKRGGGDRAWNSCPKNHHRNRLDRWNDVDHELERSDSS